MSSLLVRCPKCRKEVPRSSSVFHCDACCKVIFGSNVAVQTLAEEHRAGHSPATTPTTWPDGTPYRLPGAADGRVADPGAVPEFWP